MEQERNLFARMKKGLFKSREFLTQQIEGLFTKREKIDSGFFDELEEILILADLGIKATTEILENLKEMVFAVCLIFLLTVVVLYSLAAEKRADSSAPISG